MRIELFQPTLAGEARLLILIDSFTREGKSLEGRTKLAKLDFLLRYPNFLKRALEIRVPNRRFAAPIAEADTLEYRMIRYRYGPWDPAYFSLLGRLIGRGLVVPIPIRTGIGYRTTEQGRDIASQLAMTEEWKPVADSAILLRRHFDLTGTTLKNFIYEHFPEVTQAGTGSEL